MSLLSNEIDFLAVFIDDAGAISAVKVGNPHMSGGDFQTHVITRYRAGAIGNSQHHITVLLR